MKSISEKHAVSLPADSSIASSSVLASDQEAPERPALLALADVMDDGVFWVDRLEIIRYWNAAMSQIANLTPETGTAKLAHIISELTKEPLEQGLLLEMIRSLLTAGSHKKTRLDDFPIELGNGRSRQVELELIAMEEMGGVVVIAHDVTRRVKAQSELEALLRYCSEGIVVIGQDGQITLFNDAMEKLTGYRREEVLYQEGIWQRIFQCSEQCQPFNEMQHFFPGRVVVSEQSEGASIEQLIVGRDGKKRWVQVSSSPIYDFNGKTSSIICVVRDIHDKKRAEAQMQVHHKLATLGELISGLAHEIRNPLGIIRSASDVVANEERPMPQRREAAVFIRHEVKRLGKIMDALLNMAAPARVDSEPFNLNDLLQRILNFYAPQREDLHIITSLDPALPRVFGCRDAIQTIFLNLILNADQAMQDGGTLTIRSEAHGTNTRIIFSDTGPGIPPGIMENIFNPFFTTKKDGTGMGLPLVAHVVKAHGGSVLVENGPEGGAVFTLEIPGIIKVE